MNQEPKELTLEESMKQVMQTLPPPIRNYLAQGRYTAVAKSLMGKYRLRIDQAGVLEREIMLLLMGVETPQDFTQALVAEAALSQPTISSIIQDVNAQIFVPLRDEMRRGPVSQPAKPNVATRTPVQPPRPQNVAPQVRPQTPPTTQPPRPTAEPEHYFHLQNKIPPRPSATQSPSQPAPSTRQPLANPTIAPLPPKRILPQGQRMQAPPTRRLLEDHEEPHIEFKKTTPQARPTVTFGAGAPQNLPGTNIGSSTPPPLPALPKPAVQLPRQPVQPPRPVTPPVQSYSTDPYREPIGGDK